MRDQEQTLRLYLTMVGMKEEELRTALGADEVARRFMAAYVVGDRRLPWHVDLIGLLTDPSDAVRQSARRGLIILSFLVENPNEGKLPPDFPLDRMRKPADFGPTVGASKAARWAAQDRWTGWFAEHATDGGVIRASATVRVKGTSADRGPRAPETPEALAAAITTAATDDRGDLRELLAGRMGKATEPALRQYLDHKDPEVRGAAAMGLARRGSKFYVGRLTELLTDPDPLVQRAARWSLCQLSGQDFGPRLDATDAERAEAVARWKDWWAGKR